VREALFDVLGTRIDNARFLDAYAGTGAVGVEALSRGAARVVFLERDPRMLRLVAANLRVGAWRGTAVLVAGDVERSLRRLARGRERFGVIFLDPPYDDPPGAPILAAAGRLLEPSGILVVEHRAARPLAAPAGGNLLAVRTYRHGDTALTTFAPAAAPAGPPEAERPGSR
jgi:16S rRNA (guanine(966)-N(2))-methyltransferase RsmD